MKLRQATAEDIPAMHRVRLAVRENVLRDPARVTLDDYRRLIERDGCGWVAELDGAVVGFAVADRIRRNVWALFVDPVHEHRGVGRALHALLLDWLFAAGSGDVWLSTARGSRAERFYDTAGWCRNGVHDDGEQRFEMSAERYAELSSARTTAQLREQAAYYRARAAEYDAWWLRRGRYDRGATANAHWFAETAAVQAALDDFAPAGRVLELAGGTGIWSERLRNFASELTVVDASSEMLARNKARLRDPCVRHVEADVFDWRPDRRHDVVFFAFWLSHVPAARFAQFWRLVGDCLAPNGRVFCVDSRFESTSTAADHRHERDSRETQRRQLDDGRAFDVYKIYYEPAQLEQRLAALGWTFKIVQTDRYFWYGSGAPTA